MDRNWQLCLRLSILSMLTKPLNGRGGGQQKSIVMVNASKKSKNVTSLNPLCLSFTSRSAWPLCEVYRDCQAEGCLLFWITGLKRSESLSAQRHRLVKAISLVRKQQNPTVLLTHPYPYYKLLSSCPWEERSPARRRPCITSLCRDKQVDSYSSRINNL